MVIKILQKKKTNKTQVGVKKVVFFVFVCLFLVRELNFPRGVLELFPALDIRNLLTSSLKGITLHSGY